MQLARRYFLRLLGLVPLTLMGRKLVSAAPPVTFGLFVATDSLTWPATDWSQSRIIGGVILDEPMGKVVAEVDFTGQ